MWYNICMIRRDLVQFHHPNINQFALYMNTFEIVAGITLLTIGAVMAFLSIRLWTKSGNSFIVAGMLFPYSVLKRKNWNSTEKKMIPPYGKFNCTIRPFFFDVMIGDDNNFMGKFCYYGLHVFFWPIRALLNILILMWLGICAFQMYEKPTTQQDAISAWTPQRSGLFSYRFQIRVIIYMTNPRYPFGRAPWGSCYGAGTFMGIIISKHCLLSNLHITPQKPPKTP